MSHEETWTGDVKKIVAAFLQTDEGNELLANALASASYLDVPYDQAAAAVAASIDRQVNE